MCEDCKYAFYNQKVIEVEGETHDFRICDFEIRYCQTTGKLEVYSIPYGLTKNRIKLTQEEIPDYVLAAAAALKMGLIDHVQKM